MTYIIPILVLILVIAALCFCCNFIDLHTLSSIYLGCLGAVVLISVIQLFGLD